MRRIMLLLTTALALLGLVSGPAQAATSATAARTLVYYETADSVQFIPACTPGPDNPGCDPRGPGSVLITSGPLSETQGGAPVGSVETRCDTTRKTGGDYYGVCTVTLDTPEGRFTAVGEINESGLERYEPQTIALTGVRGELTIQQVVYPDVFKLTLRIA